MFRGAMVAMETGVWEAGAMRTPAVVACVLSGVVVAGLCALAVTPLLVPISETPDTVTAVTTSQPVQTPAVSSPPTPGPTPEEVIDGPVDFVNLGNGMLIPAGRPEGCAEPAYIWIGSIDGGPMHADMLGAELVDRGVREFATGEAATDSEGRPATYTVAPGDVLDIIGDRFCIYNGIALGTLNGYRSGEIQPGDVLTLDADLVTDWVSPYDD